MLESISLKAVASYSPDQVTEIKPLKRVNIFYGHNGTGKSTVSNYLQNDDPLDFLDCSTKYSGDKPEFLVFNERFIEKNFHQGWQPGVFTLNKDNVDAEKAIEGLEQDSKLLAQERDEAKSAGVKESRSIESEKENLRSEAWKLKKKYDSESLKYCFKGFNSDSAKFLDELLNKNTVDTSLPTTAELEKSALELHSASNVQRTWPQQISFPEKDIESSPIYSEVIIASGESYLKALIEKIGNSDWVRESLQYIPISEGKCPLCQQDAPKDLEAHISNLFDESYREKIATISAMETRYGDGVSALITKLRTNSQYQLTPPHKESLDSALREFEA